jgi:hypothetical protein
MTNSRHIFDRGKLGGGDDAAQFSTTGIFFDTGRVPGSL